MRPEINRPRYEVFAIFAFVFHFHTMIGIFALFYIEACFRVLPALKAKISKFLSPAWRSDYYAMFGTSVQTPSRCT
jgi:hypothetical protein